MPDASRPRVLLACSGLEHALRGFESFARDCFEALRDEEGIDLELVKGSGPAGERERSVRTITRDNPIARALGRATGREPFRFEQVAFGLSLQPLLLRRRPDVVYFSEWHTGLVLAALKRATRLRFRTVLSNGTMAVANFEHLDHVQELTPAALEGNIAMGADPRRHSMLPLGFALRPEHTPVGDDERAALRRRFGLPADRHVVVSVAALNKHHKRLDYLVEEVARLPEAERPYLLMLGQPEPETPSIRALAAQRLGPDGHDIRSVPQADVEPISRACDTFVLASLGEGLPRALIEGLATGLPCLTHDYGVTRFALGEHGSFADFTRPGALAGLLRERLAAEDPPGAAAARHRYAYESFSWDRLRPRYVEMLRTAARDGPTPAPPS
ncbi:MAG: glycosyltransferase family 4 protein [Actinomycetota bacterium]|nr:glycosyltransferase family 4 protein [Actinomycetota bacterium]